MKRFTWFNITALTLGFAFLYLPMVILVIYSFNESKLVTVWAGFSTKWYGELLPNEAFLDAAWVTLKVAVMSSTSSRCRKSTEGCAVVANISLCSGALAGLGAEGAGSEGDSLSSCRSFSLALSITARGIPASCATCRP